MPVRAGNKPQERRRVATEMILSLDERSRAQGRQGGRGEERGEGRGDSYY